MTFKLVLGIMLSILVIIYIIAYCIGITLSKQNKQNNYHG